MQLTKTRSLAGMTALAGALALTACIPPSPEPTPAPSPAPTPTPTPTAAQPEAAPPQVVTPSFDNWMDAPQTPGDWVYSADPGETFAVFTADLTPGGVKLMIRCDLQTRRVGIGRAGGATGQVEMLVRTETQDRRLTARQLDVSTPVVPLIFAEVAASDPLLDAMAFSKGRFAVDVAGEDPVYAPAWPEITRVIEDCRG
ncbi:hypothetical protein [Aurantiacibacter hainanensis]|uniref:hypothetical protein n=1 Tax=Aurantiacibacter hainanensis TaxID=3076114 RepID=UPI0030C67DC5